MSMRRREFLWQAGVGLIAASAEAIRSRRAYGRAAGEVIYAGFGGSFMEAMKKAWFQPFEAETGIRVRVAPPDLGKLAAMVETKTVEWDVVDVPGSFIGTGIAKNLFDSLDYKVINTDGLEPGQYGELAISYLVFATILAWSTRRYSGSNVPATWADFWDVQRFPGPRGMINVGTPWVVLAAALMADGVPPDHLFPMDLDRAFPKVDRLGPHTARDRYICGERPGPEPAGHARRRGRAEHDVGQPRAADEGGRRAGRSRVEPGSP